MWRSARTHHGAPEADGLEGLLPPARVEALTKAGKASRRS